MKILKFLLFAVSIFFADVSFAKNSVFIKSVQIIDSQTDKITEPMDIEIIDGVIADIGLNLNTKLKNVIDAKGLFLMPGLIDCHTHLRSVPGAFFRQDTRLKIEQQQLSQLRSYLAAGVTTVLDAAAPESLFSELNEIAKKNTIPRVLGLAPFLTPENGYFSSEGERQVFYQDLWEPISNSEQVVKHIEKALPLNSLGVKVTVENGLGPFSVWPQFNKKIRDTIISVSQENDLPIFVHSYSENEFEEALKYKPYAFVHSGFNESLPSTDILEKLKESEAYIISTLAVYKMMMLMWDQDLFDEAWFKRLVPSEQIRSAREEKNTKIIINTMARNSSYKWLPTFLTNSLSSLFINKKTIQKQLEQSKKSIFKMYKHGLPIVMGADAGNWPLFTTYFHGVGSILEMEALVDSGIPASEVIKAATVRAAKLLKIDSKVGSVQRGKIADLLLVKSNPLVDIRALREIKMVIKAGVAKSPDDWMK